MDRLNILIDWLATRAGRFFGWMFSTRNGWIIFGIVAFVVMMKFQPELLTNLVSNTCAWIINLIARIIEANRHSLEMLFSIALLCFGAIMMLRAVFGKKGGTPKK